MEEEEFSYYQSICRNIEEGIFEDGYYYPPHVFVTPVAGAPLIIGGGEYIDTDIEYDEF